jgi:putative DNA primase/helicase
MELEEFLSRCEKVQNHGAYYTVSCPGHEDHRNSLSVRLSDDGKILLKCHAGCPAAQITDALGIRTADLFTAAAPPPPNQRTAAARPQSRPSPQPPARHQSRPSSPSQRPPKRREPVEVYPYTDADGQLLYEVLRYEPKDFRQRRPDPEAPGQHVYSLNGVERVLYRLPRILAAHAATPAKGVWLVEGEKDVHSLESLGLIATTAAGGAGKWLPQYTEALASGPVFILPDNDTPGQRHAEHVASQLPNAWVISLPDLPEKGDVTDWVKAGGTRDALIALARDAMAGRAAPAAAAARQYSPWPFRALGYDQGAYYFYSPRTRQTLTLTANTLRNRISLFDLAPLDWWGHNYAGEKGIDWTRAADDLVRAAQKAGLFDPRRRRGRGAWVDKGRTVLHQGDTLIVDGSPVAVDALESSYIYELAPRLSWPQADPADDDTGARILDLFRSLTWDTPIGGDLLAGWTFLAPVCGILPWRPHVWLTGASGTGKTWVQEHVISPLVGPLALRVQSVTTEAGLRQTLGQDARPVIFDEAELDDDRGSLNIQRVMELARQASSETGATIAKGTMHGRAQHFAVRSMFLLSSISVGVRRRADETRITVLSLGRPRAGIEGQEHFRTLQIDAVRLTVPEVSAALIARACKLAPVIRATYSAFAAAIGFQAGSRRQGDQLGALLAGAWCLTHSTPPTADEITACLARLSLDDLTPDESTTDERACLAAILERTLRVEAVGAHGTPRGAVERSLGELVDLASSYTGGDDVLPETARDALRRVGIRVQPDGLAISTSHSGTAALLRGTPYSTQWGRILRRLPGTGETKIKWPGGSNTRAVVIPWPVLRGAEPPAPPAPPAPPEPVEPMEPVAEEAEEEELF